jgi:uncharacterized membrane protein YgaE (UPF0421/DUF939 family)
MRRVAAELAAGLRGELAELTLDGPRARQATMAALSVGLAVVVALALRLQDPWWAGISGFVCTQASQPQSLQKSGLRVAGTLAGAAVGFAFASWTSYDPAATLLALFFAGTLANLGALLSPHGYAWLLGGITIVMVTLGSLDDPSQALPVAFYRTAEIVVGVASALLVARLLAPPGSGSGAAAPGWRSLLGTHWHALSHATRSGLAIAAVPLVWRQLELPNLSQMAISISAVMAVPVLSGVPDADQAAIVQRVLHRAAGCLLGGGVGLVLLAWPASQSFAPWLFLLTGGTWVAMQVQTGRHGIGNVGTQAAFALILTMVQGWGPPASLTPAVGRIAGMLGAIGLLLLVGLLLGPPAAADDARPVG